MSGTASIRCRYAIVGWALAYMGLGTAHSGTSSFESLAQMVMERQHEAALHWAEQHIEHAGKPGFDFHYGIAAIEAGQPSIGVFALLRYLAAYPENRTARFYLARGYFILGEDALARPEFEQLLETANPDERAVILQYLDAIWERESRYFPRRRLWTEIGLGHDDNLNEGVPPGSVKGLTSITIHSNSANRRSADGITWWGLGVDLSYPLMPGLSWLGHTRLNGHQPWRRTQFNERQAVVGMALAWESGRHLWRSGWEYFTQWTDGQRLMSNQTAFVDWHWRVDQFQRWGAALSGSSLDYRDVLLHTTLDRTGPKAITSDGLRDSYLLQLSIHHTRYFSHPWAPAWKNTLIAGQERNRRGQPDLSRDFWSLHTQLSLRPADRWLVQAGLGYLDSRHRAPLANGLEHRHDHRWQIMTTLAWRWTSNWQLIGEWSYINQHSNIGLHDHERQRWLLKVRYEFK